MIYFGIGMFALALALTMLTLRHRRRRGQNIEWSEQVTVLRIIPEQVVHGIPEEVAWDGITLDVAVERYMALPPAERAGLMILTPEQKSLQWETDRGALRHEEAAMAACREELAEGIVSADTLPAATARRGFAERARAKATQAVDQLILKRASASCPSGEWDDDDFDVLADGVVVGRIK